MNVGNGPILPLKIKQNSNKLISSCHFVACCLSHKIVALQPHFKPVCQCVWFLLLLSKFTVTEKNLFSLQSIVHKNANTHTKEHNF